MVELIKPDQKKWSDFITQTNGYDFYHTAEYHSLEGNDEPLLFLTSTADGFVALPIIIRKIKGTKYFDCTSVYGYCGPITNIKEESTKLPIIHEFTKSLKEFFVERNIVSAFSRLHPLIDNDKFLMQMGTVVNLNKTVAIDLRLSPEEQRKQYRKSNKSEINQLRRKGFEVKEAQSAQEIDEFIEIYHQTMNRVSASNMYYFDRNYFSTFLQSKDFNSKLLLAYKDGKVAAGAIFTITDRIMQYHLAGTDENYMRETPMKLVIDEARFIGNGLNLDFLHLGGGVGGNLDDSLFRFKSGFSDQQFQFRVWQYIVDEKIYNELVMAKEDPSINSNYFPLYRA